MAHDYQRTKLTIEVREDQMNALRKHIPWGSQRAFFEVLIDDIVRVLNEHGSIVVYAALTNNIRPGEYSPILRALMEKKT